MENIVKTQQAVGRTYQWIIISKDKRDYQDFLFQGKVACVNPTCLLQGQFMFQSPSTYVIYYYCPKCYSTWYVKI